MRCFIAYVLFGLGNAVSVIANITRLPLYRLYNWLMLKSEAVQGNGEGPWFSVKGWGG